MITYAFIWFGLLFISVDVGCRIAYALVVRKWGLASSEENATTLYIREFWRNKKRKNKALATISCTFYVIYWILCLAVFAMTFAYGFFLKRGAK